MFCELDPQAKAQSCFEWTVLEWFCLPCVLLVWAFCGIPLSNVFSNGDMNNTLVFSYNHSLSDCEDVDNLRMTAWCDFCGIFLWFTWFIWFIFVFIWSWFGKICLGCARFICWLCWSEWILSCVIINYYFLEGLWGVLLSFNPHWLCVDFVVIR